MWKAATPLGGPAGGQAGRQASHGLPAGCGQCLALLAHAPPLAAGGVAALCQWHLPDTRYSRESTPCDPLLSTAAAAVLLLTPPSWCAAGVACGAGRKRVNERRLSRRLASKKQQRELGLYSLAASGITYVSRQAGAGGRTGSGQAVASSLEIARNLVPCPLLVALMLFMALREGFCCWGMPARDTGWRGFRNPSPHPCRHCCAALNESGRPNHAQPAASAQA